MVLGVALESAHGLEEDEMAALEVRADVVFLHAFERAVVTRDRLVRCVRVSRRMKHICGNYFTILHNSRQRISHK